MKVYASKDYVEESISKHSSFVSGHLTFKNIDTKFPRTHCARRIVYGNGRFVAIFAGGFYYSENGVQWNSGSLPYVNYVTWDDIAYGCGRFVAVGHGSYSSSYSNQNQFSLVSDDGVNWYVNDMIYHRNYRVIEYIHNKFYVLPHDSSEVFVSEDGLTWTKHSMNIASADWDSIAYGNGVFVATGFSTRDDLTGEWVHALYYSNDGIKYSKANLPYSDFGEGHVTFGNGTFLTVLADRAAISKDGQVWQEVYIPINSHTKCYFFCEKFLIFDGVNFAYSYDGITWTINQLPAEFSVSDIAFDSNVCIAVSAEANSFIYSLDGVTWNTSEKFLKQGDIDVTESFKEYLEIPTKDELISEVLAALPTWTGGSY